MSYELVVTSSFNQIMQTIRSIYNNKSNSNAQTTTQNRYGTF